MPEFLQLLPPNDALTFLLANFSPPIETELIQSKDSLGRVNIGTIIAPYGLPSFPRSTVDGYALRAEDTFGASESLPMYLKLAGEIPMGAPASVNVERTSCALIHTGGMLPEGADAVVMVEYTQSINVNEVEILRSVAVGENVLKLGEDVEAGQEVISRGSRIRPAEIGGLMALGITSLQVARRPRVGIISSGDEVVHPDADLEPGMVRDINSYSLAALVEQSGGRPILYGIVPDKVQELRKVAGKALDECDLVVITAGSSASARDLTAEVINQLGKPGVLVHGVNVRPGKPTILGVCNGKPVIGLPGNPVSALVIATLFVAPVIEKYLGSERVRLKPSVSASLKVNLASQTGREDWIAVRLVGEKGSLQADPIFGKSNLIFTLVRADGLVRIPASANGLSAGEKVEVLLF